MGAVARTTLKVLAEVTPPVEGSGAMRPVLGPRVGLSERLRVFIHLFCTQSSVSRGSGHHLEGRVLQSTVRSGSKVGRSTLESGKKSVVLGGGALEGEEDE